MMEMIRERRNSEKKEERYDLFSSLLDASDDTSDGEVALTDSELVGSSKPSLTAEEQHLLGFA